MAAEEQNPEEQNPQGDAPLEQLAPPVNENFKWYIIHAYSGFERKVRESLESRITAFGLQNKIGRIMIPTEPVTELRNGKKYTIDRVFLPGYVLVEMDLDNDLWHVIKNTPRVTGFLGTGDNPVALSEQEVSSILFRSDAAKDKPNNAKGTPSTVCQFASLPSCRSGLQLRKSRRSSLVCQVARSGAYWL